MGLLQKLYYWLGPYVDSRERQVGRYFSKLSEHGSATQARTKLLELMQSNVAVINLWTEYKYKGYKYLRKSHRRGLYANLDIITVEFETFRASHTCSPEYVVKQLRVAPGARVKQDRIALLIAIMEYLTPGKGVYEYRSSSSFGRLLRDPNNGVLVGDCNQIVTLYIYLYSRYFPVQDLQVRLLPAHIALHYGGVDIEATNGTFADYTRTKDAVLMPIEEIVSVNLLDITDSYLDTHEVSPEDFLQAARFAYVLSHDRDIVTRNLEAAYVTITNALMKKHNFSRALKFAKQSRGLELRAVVGNNGAIYSIKRHQFAAARRFATYAVNKAALIRDSYHAEGVHHYKDGQYQQAIQAFKNCDDQSSINKCYNALFFAEQSTLPKQLTSENIRGHAKTLKLMHSYAKKSGNKELIQHVDRLNKYL